MGEQLAECYANNYEMNISILRLFNVFGVMGKGILNILIERAKSHEEIQIYGEDQLRDFIYVSDVADTFVKLLQAQRKGLNIYNVGTGIGMSIQDLIEIIREYYPDLTIKYPSCNSPSCNSKLYDSVADTSKLRSVIDFRPSNSCELIRKIVFDSQTSGEEQ
jgi:nucleoside-diphosphate-sugar epimerase